MKVKLKYSPTCKFLFALPHKNISKTSHTNKPASYKQILTRVMQGQFHRPQAPYCMSCYTSNFLVTVAANRSG